MNEGTWPQALAELERSAASMISDPAAALELITREAHAIWVETEKDAKIGGSVLLDGLCLTIGRDVPPDRRRSGPRHPGIDETVVYVVTDLYEAGGHTRLLEDLIRARPDAEHVLLWAGENDAADNAELASILRVRGATIHRLPGSAYERMLRGIALLDVYRPDVLVHLGHPNDPVPVALMQPRDGCKRVVIHHADYCFALGRSIPGATHVSLTRQFTVLAEERWNLKTAFLEMSCLDPEDASPRDCGFVTASSGAAHKFELAGTPSYLDVLRERFMRREGTHVHFGTLHGDQLDRIYRMLEEIGAVERFAYVEFVPLLASAIREAGVRVFIDSVPKAGAKTLVEAMAAGATVCFSGHDPLRDGSCFAYDGAFIWKDAAELGDFLERADESTLNEGSRLAREHFERHHAPAVFASAFDSILRNARRDEIT